MATLMQESPNSEVLLAKLNDGDDSLLGEVLESYRERLMRIVGFRLDRRLRGRIDPADVLQETFLEATQRYAQFKRQDKMSLFVWVRFLAVQQMLIQHRHHLGTKARDAGREVSLHHAKLPGASSADIANLLIGRQTTPSQVVARAEMKRKLEEALNSMEEIDREVLTMRHMEHLSNVETANALDISTTAASNRYIRAIRRLKITMESQ